MTYQRIIRKRAISPDGKAIAEAVSRVVVSENSNHKISQSISTKVTRNASSSSSSSGSSSSFSSSSGSCSANS